MQYNVLELVPQQKNSRKHNIVHTLSPHTPQTFPDIEAWSSPGLVQALLRGDTGVLGEVSDTYSSIFCRLLFLITRDETRKTIHP